MNITSNATPFTAAYYALVLHDGTEKDILGLWGPYLGEELAQTVLNELKSWPLDGTWTVMELKLFIPGGAAAKTTNPTTVTWTTNTDPTVTNG